MAISKIEVINKALITLGSNLITDTLESSQEATLVNAIYDQVRRALLRSHPWNFAIKDIELPAVQGGGNYNYQYQYNLPADHLRLLTVNRNNNFKMQGKSIFTNDSSCRIKYIADIEDPSLWDASFADVMSFKLAAELAFAQTKSSARSQEITALYEDALRKARNIDASEDIQDQIAPYDSPLLGARF